MNDYKKLINDYIEEHTEDMISFLKELISYRSVQGEAEENAPFGKENKEVLDRFIAECEKFGFKTENFQGYAAHADMNELAPKLGILCHLDVVPEGTGWTGDPYKAEVKDGKVIGRGAIDDKGPAVMALYAMKCISDLKIPLKHGVRLIAGCNEENGSEDMEYYRKKTEFPELLVTPDGNYPLINIEKGMLRCEFSADMPENCALVSLHGGSVINAVPDRCTAKVKDTSPEEVAESAKGIENVKFTAVTEGNLTVITAEGSCAHASTPEQGYNAVTAMLRLLDDISADTGVPVSVLNSMFPYGETDGGSAGVKCSDDISGELTLVLSVIDIENGSINGKCDCRFPVSKTLSEISEKLCGAFEGDNIDAQIILGVEPHYVDSDSEFVRSLLAVYEDVTGNKGECIAIGGGTYVHETENGVAFGAEFPGEDNHMHGADEFITIDNLKLNAKIYANMIIALAGK